MKHLEHNEQVAVVKLPYPPSVNRAWRNSNGKMYQPKEITDYKRYAGWLAKGGKIIDGDVGITAILHPKLTKKGEASKTRIDLDNLTKIVLDSFNGVLYRDDSQITEILLKVGEPIKDGGVTVTIYDKGEK